MDKPAPCDWPIDALVSARWSPRAFTDEPVGDAQLAQLMEATRWAPSCYNAQPWSLVLATRDQPDAHAAMLDCLVEFNQSWAKAAPVLGFAVARTQFEHNEQPNAWAWHDVGMALGNMATQATAMGLAVHFMAGFDAEAAQKALAIPEPFVPTTAFALGHAGSPDSLPEDLRQRETEPRQRKPLASFVHTGQWGQIASFVKD